MPFSQRVLINLLSYAERLPSKYKYTVFIIRRTCLNTILRFFLNEPKSSEKYVYRNTSKFMCPSRRRLLLLFWHRSVDPDHYVHRNVSTLEVFFRIPTFSQLIAYLLRINPSFDLFAKDCRGKFPMVVITLNEPVILWRFMHTSSCERNMGKREKVTSWAWGQRVKSKRGRKTHTIAHTNSDVFAG